jgi:hypothetical protein
MAKRSAQLSEETYHLLTLVLMMFEERSVSVFFEGDP